MDKIVNPFPVITYQGAEYFCDRTNETEKILEALKNGRNLTLTALRRMGKTGLIQHVMEQLKSRKSVKTFYVDLYPTQSQADLLKTLARHTLGKLDANHIKLMRELANFFTHLRPVIQYDPLSGAPAIEFTLDENFQAEHSFEQVFSYLERSGQQVVIAMDEFQQIAEYKEKNTEALLRTFVQRSKNIRFIFSGSHSSMLQSMFRDQSRPFYQSTDILHLGPIEHEIYRDFICSKFSEAKRKLSDENADRILDWCRHHTYYVQLVCNRLFSKGIRQPDDWYIENLFREIIQENQPVYYSYRKLLTTNQWILLQGIAREKGARQVMGADFIRKNELGTPSSVQTALQALQDKEMIYEEDDRWWVYDVFLSRWLEG
ncbi:MAG: ATP-binding protein [Bacteroidia bacterium]